MRECFKCGISEEKTLLVDAITSKGIVKACRKCVLHDDLPLVRKSTETPFREPEKGRTVYDRLSRVAGLSKENNRSANPELKNQEASLRELVDKNFESSLVKKGSYDDLIDNFHWALMRARRLTKLSPEQLAEKIDEPPQAIKLAEKGILGKNYLGLIRKLQGFFGIILVKEDMIKQEPRSVAVVNYELLGKPEAVFERDVSKNLTIYDLKKLKEKHDLENSNKKDDYSFNEAVGEDENAQEFVKKEELPKEKDSAPRDNPKRDLTKEEIDRILFRRQGKQ